MRMATICSLELEVLLVSILTIYYIYVDWPVAKYMHNMVIFRPLYILCLWHFAVHRDLKICHLFFYAELEGDRSDGGA